MHHLGALLHQVQLAAVLLLQLVSRYFRCLELLFEQLVLLEALLCPLLELFYVKVSCALLDFVFQGLYLILFVLNII